MPAKRFYAVEKHSYKSKPDGAFSTVHCFSSEAGRDEWVARKSRLKSDADKFGAYLYREPIKARNDSEALRKASGMSGLRRGCIVRHLCVGLEQNA